jgi:hypothetical protein
MHDSEYFSYLGRAVKKEHFRAFVYNAVGEKALANSYDEYIAMTSTGQWFDEAPKKFDFDGKRRKGHRKDE